MMRAVLGCFVLSFTSTLAWAGETWPEFRGPTGDGHSDCRGLPVTWSETENVVWKTAIHGKAWSSPVIWGDRIWMTASAFHIPLQDRSVDGVVCCRLCHHLPTVAERERLVAELLRVARRFVVMTFFDYHSLKNTLRRARRPLDGKPPKMTMTVDRVRELARGNGAELVAEPALSRLFSGHRYALMVRR